MGLSVGKRQLSMGGLMRGVKKVFNKKKIQNSQGTSLSNENNIIFGNNLNNNYLW